MTSTNPTSSEERDSGAAGWAGGGYRKAGGTTATEPAGRFAAGAGGGFVWARPGDRELATAAGALKARVVELAPVMGVAGATTAERDGNSDGDTDLDAT